MDLAFILARQIVIMFLLMSVGVALKKVGWLSKGTVKELNNFLLVVVVSCAILNSFQGDNSPELLQNFFYSLLLSLAANIIGISLAIVIFGKKDIKRRLSIFGASYSNCSFMAFPLLLATFGETGLLYGAGYAAIFNLLLWTHGISLYDDSHNLNFKQKLKNIFTSPVILSILLGVTMFSLNLRLPPLISDVVAYIADLNTPFAMILLGVFVAGCNPKTLFSDKLIFVSVAMKLIGMPLAVLLFMKVLSSFVVLDNTLMLSVLICSGSCTAGTMALLSERYEKDIDYSVKIVTLSTLLCLVTIPLTVVLAKSIL